MPTQVTLSRTLTSILPQTTDGLEPKAVWELVRRVGRIILDDYELLGSSDASMICHECLAPLGITLRGGAVTVLKGVVDLSDYTEITLTCSECPEHLVHPSCYEAARAALKDV